MHHQHTMMFEDTIEKEQLKHLTRVEGHGDSIVTEERKRPPHLSGTDLSRWAAAVTC